MPNELLSRCFGYLKVEHVQGCLETSSERDIQNVRLVSQKCNALRFSLLISSARVFITSYSLSHFEELSQHPVFSKSIKAVEINGSYYDSCVTNDRGPFAQHNSARLYQAVECFKRFGRYAPLAPAVDPNRLMQIRDECNRVSHSEFQKESGSEKQRLLVTAYEQYRRWYDSQERAKQEGAHIKRVCVSPTRLITLESIVINNRVSHRRSAESEYFSDQELFNSCLLASAWKGPFTTVTCKPAKLDIDDEKDEDGVERSNALA